MQPTHTDQAREHLDARMVELDAEREGIATALEALSSTNGSVSAPTRRGRPKGSKAKRRKGSRKGGTRADQAVELVRSQPGIKAAEIAKTMRIKPNYLYRVLDRLVKQRRLKKVGLTYELGAKETKIAPAKARIAAGKAKAKA